MCRAGGRRCPSSGGNHAAATAPAGAVEVADRAAASHDERRRVDANGFVIGTDRAPGAFGGRPSVGGLGATVKTDDGRIGLIVGLDNTKTGGLALDLVWIDGKKTSEAARNRVMNAYERGHYGDAVQVPAEGLIALDAYLPDQS